MSSKIIEYDLKKPGRDYESLYEAIKAYPVRAHITESTWFVKTDDTCVQVRDALKEKVDSNDRIFVATLTGEAAWSNLICKSEYLKENL